MPTAAPWVGRPLHGQLNFPTTRALGLRWHAQGGRNQTSAARGHWLSPGRLRRFHRLQGDRMV